MGFHCFIPLRIFVNATGKGTTSEVAEKLTNACNNVEERRFSAA